MARKKLPEPWIKTVRLQPLFHQDIIDFLESCEDQSVILRAALRLAKDRPDLIEQYIKLDEARQFDQITLNEWMKNCS
ncbi:hypothetical protein CTH_10020 (plasmid) [Carboxydocella thermautotrophica]|nr:hypothetical protein CTH_10020 [Carboxydocella thermautotrophica]